MNKPYRVPTRPSSARASDDTRGLTCRLTNEEKTKLAIWAKQAYQRMAAGGATDETETEFRHRLAIQACGRRISEAIRADYSALATTFLAAAGQTKRAIHSAERGETEGRRIALVKLTELLKSKGKDVSYAKPLLWNFYHVTLEKTSAKQL